MNDMMLHAPTCCVGDDFVIRAYMCGDESLLSESVTISYDHLKQFMPWAKHTQTIGESQSVIAKAMANYSRTEDFMLGIFSPDETTQWGGTGFHLREGPLETRSAEIGLWIRAEFAHQGMGTRVLSAMLNWGFTAWPWERLTWRCDADNIASARVAEKCGMQLEGRLRGHRRKEDGSRVDTLCYAALRS